MDAILAAADGPFMPSEADSAIIAISCCCNQKQSSTRMFLKLLLHKHLLLDWSCSAV